MTLLELESALERVNLSVDGLPEGVLIRIDIPVTTWTRRVGFFRKVETITRNGSLLVTKVFFDAKRRELVIRGE